MRLTINLDDELYAVARSFAQTMDVSISVAVNQLLRRAIYPTEPIPLPFAAEGDNAWPVVAGKRVVTPEDVKALDDEA
jgi:antitoxin component of RelBE/YafQ-DinJ toxin-antitoxin module